VSDSKLRECYGIFKSICDRFSIDIDEFERIFGLTKEEAYNEFLVWDTDETTIVDGLEIFTGLAIFSKAGLPDKIRCSLGSRSHLRRVRLQ
jgi:hypothetical protein